MKIEVKQGTCAGCPFRLDGLAYGTLRSYDNSTYFNMQIFPFSKQPTQLTIRDNRGCDTRIKIPRATVPISTVPIVNWSLNDKLCSARYRCLQDPSIVYGIETLPLEINLPFNKTHEPCELVEVKCNIDGIHDIGATFNGQVTLVNGEKWYNGIIKELVDRDCLWSVTCVFDHPNSIVGRLKVQAEGIRNCFAIKSDDKPSNSLYSLKKTNTSLEVISASPNPFKDEINILVQSNNSGVMRINLVNQLGQVIDTKLTEVNKGYSQTQMLINPNLIPEGIYMLVISDDNGFRNVTRILHTK
jgi:hypothetical protein